MAALLCYLTLITNRGHRNYPNTKTWLTEPKPYTKKLAKPVLLWRRQETLGNCKNCRLKRGHVWKNSIWNLTHVLKLDIKWDTLKTLETKPDMLRKFVFKNWHDVKFLIQNHAFEKSTKKQNLSILRGNMKQNLNFWMQTSLQYLTCWKSINWKLTRDTS